MYTFFLFWLLVGEFHWLGHHTFLATISPFLIFFIEVKLTNSIVLISGVQHTDSAFVYVAKCSPQQV